ncbi:oligosaccharide flippase family protein [Acidovorax sp.]|uniref:oligosaccharide flippase family protein n=1 Tax=Acidovorax sp. TaxID=1872122 RepID=UPI00261F72AE|nr:oligosaccharide flippase family protein [Acidovorax sp.]
MHSRNHAFNIGLNVAGMVLPMLAGALTVPGLLHRLGQERFGILALSWALVGYFGFLDLGIGRALTQHLASAEKAGTSREEQATLACAARRLLGGFSLFWALLLWLLLPWLASFVQMSADLHAQVLAAIPLLALAVPFTMWFTCSAGVLEARSRFGAVNSVRIPAGVGNFLLPWFVSMFTTDLSWVIGSILGGRLVSAASMALWAKPEFFHATSHWPTKSITELLRFGGWMTLSNLVGPLMSYFDRFAIAALATVTAVTHYTVPFDVLSRLPMVPIAVMAVLLPLLAQANQTTHSTNDHNPTARRTVILLLICWIPGMVLIAWTGPLFLEWWVGAEMSQASTPIWRWLAIGVLVNGLAHLPFTMLQSAGRTDIIAKIHLLELLPYGVGLWWALNHYGVVGAAILWSLRVSIDMGLLFICASQIFPSWRRFFLGVTLCGLAGALTTIWIATRT